MTLSSGLRVSFYKMRWETLYWENLTQKFSPNRKPLALRLPSAPSEALAQHPDLAPGALEDLGMRQSRLHLRASLFGRDRGLDDLLRARGCRRPAVRHHPRHQIPLPRVVSTRELNLVSAFVTREHVAATTRTVFGRPGGSWPPTRTWAISTWCWGKPGGASPWSRGTLCTRKERSSSLTPRRPARNTKFAYSPGTRKATSRAIAARSVKFSTNRSLPPAAALSDPSRFYCHSWARSSQSPDARKIAACFAGKVYWAFLGIWGVLAGAFTFDLFGHNFFFTMLLCSYYDQSFGSSFIRIFLQSFIKDKLFLNYCLTIFRI